MSYSTKFASAFYGPFRDAADSTPQHGDRQSYQMDPANAREALRESLLDEAEGADVLMVKPAGHYLDVIARLAEVDEPPDRRVPGVRRARRDPVRGRSTARSTCAAATLESLVAIRRAGAQVIMTYSAIDAAGWLDD